MTGAEMIQIAPQKVMSRRHFPQLFRVVPESLPTQVLLSAQPIAYWYKYAVVFWDEYGILQIVHLVSC